MSRFATPSMRQVSPAAETNQAPPQELTRSAAHLAPLDQTLLDDLRAGAIRTFFLFVLLIGMTMVLLIGVINPIVSRELTMALPWRTLTLLTLVTPIAAWIVQIYHYRVSVWIFTLGCAIAIVFAQLSYPTTIAITGLVFLVALIGLFIGKWASGVAVVGSSVILWWLTTFPYVQGHVQGMAPFILFLICGMVLLSWSATHPLYTVVQWSWFYYAQARNHAEAARPSG